jgi:hypothetical protein
MNELWVLTFGYILNTEAERPRITNMQESFMVIDYTVFLGFWQARE